MHAYALAFQVGDAVNVFIGKQFEATYMHAGHHRDRFASINRHDERSNEVQGEIDFTPREALRTSKARFCFHIADIGKTFCAQQLLSNILGAMQMPDILAKRMVVVSGGSSPAALTDG